MNSVGYIILNANSGEQLISHMLKYLMLYDRLLGLNLMCNRNVCIEYILDI